MSARATALRAGPLTATYLDGDLRLIRFGEDEVIRRIYLAFQDLNWTARPWLITNERIDVRHRSFEIAYDVHGTFDADPLRGSVSMSGADDGMIACRISLESSGSFLRNRLGLCVLHPKDVCGSPCTVESTDGEIRESAFPIAISPAQPFVDIRAITHRVAGPVWASLRLEGETFEMEDHRNWSDASFKTYCTPIALPFPVEVRRGDRIEQSATLRLLHAEEEPEPWDDSASIMVLDDVTSRPFIGLQVSDETPSPRQLEHLRALALDHLRLDMRSGDPGARDRLALAREQATAIGSRLIVAVTVDDEADLAWLAEYSPGVTLWLVFDPSAKVTPPGLIAAARAAFGPDTPIGGGTNLYFTELNREPPETDDLDAVAFSLNPQVHATDDLTILQNLQTQFDIALNAATLAGDAPIVIGPVTLRPRFNPNATAPDLDVSNTPLPSNVDARQRTALGAGWLAMSLKYLAEAGTVSAVTYVETVGWRGVMEREAGSLQPADFPSRPGELFPMHEVLSAVSDFPYVQASLATNPEMVDAIVLVDDSGRRRMIIANFTDGTRVVRVRDFTPDHVELPPQSYAIIDERPTP